MNYLVIMILQISQKWSTFLPRAELNSELASLQLNYFSGHLLHVLAGTWF